MPLSEKAQAAYDQVADPATKMSTIRRVAKSIRTDHALGLELWHTGAQTCRHLAMLLFDKKKIDQAFVDELEASMGDIPVKKKSHLMDWLLANQLSKSKGGKSLVESWEHSPSALQRRTYWYHQSRLRWTGQTPPPNTEALLDSVEARIEGEDPIVQMFMNFTAGQIGTYQPEYRDRCIAIGERTGLYKDEKVPRGCVPSYLPEFIRVQVAKLDR